MILRTPDYIENQIALKQLKFERAMDGWDIDTANIACAQKEYWQRELERATANNPQNIIDTQATF